MNVQKLLDETVTERISQIIQAMDPEIGQKFQAEENAILESLDKETRDKFEALIDSLAAREAEQNLAIYKVAFLDGLWLGHKAF
ncbi:MAG: hypothetical protein LUH21_26190 [Clostridiales bacterium]|nr:hypothetical protein [Clostridiales bacterium]